MNIAKSVASVSIASIITMGVSAFGRETKVGGFSRNSAGLPFFGSSSDNTFQFTNSAPTG